MSDASYSCPQCRAALVAVAKGEVDTWECADGHGVGLTLSEAYGHFQEDEIRAIWKEAQGAPQSALLSPLLGHPMVSITVAVDEDETEGNRGEGARFVTLDVAPAEQFLWFEVIDYTAMPADLPNPPPSAAEVAKMEELAKMSREGIAKAAEARESRVGELGYRVGSKTAAILGLGGFLRRLGDRSGARS